MNQTMLQLNFVHFADHGNYGKKKKKQLEKDNNDA
jgi:hypothetical protein